MAPQTRRARQPGVSKPAQRKRNPPRKETSDGWDLVDSTFGHRSSRSQQRHAQQERADEEHGVEQEQEEEDEEEGHDAQLSIEAVGDDVEVVVNPLREMAERVGKEVESFAQSLDMFLSDLPTRNKFDAARELVGAFKELTDDSVAALKKTHERELRAQLRKDWNERAQISGLGVSKKALGSTLASSTTTLARKQGAVKQIQALQEESDTWELFRLVLDLHYNPDKEGVRREKEDEIARMPKVHRYTPESELWERFYLEDDVANERRLIKQWLEQTADHQRSDLQGIVEELEAKADRGKGLWSKGWLHTREQIKAQKRLRVWSSDAGAPPQIKRTDNSELLVNTLDPDAVRRQGRTLEKPDAYFEKAMWIACWEMLRRGTSWAKILEWCGERHEGWRAISIGNAADSSDIGSSLLWRRMCLLASQSGCSSDYEAAVYGLQGGSVQPVQKISRTVDDHLYAYYNATLQRQFNQYIVQNYRERVPASLLKAAQIDDTLDDPAQAQNDIMQLINRLRQRPNTQSDIARPLKAIQSYLLANELESFTHSLGTAVARVDAQRGGTEDMIIRFPNLDNSAVSLQAEEDIALDPQALRVAAHMILILRELRTEALDADELDLEENVTVAYIQALRTAGKRDMIPLYASQLQHSRYVVTLGRVLQDIHDPKEQDTVLRLLQGQYQMDVVSILTEQVKYLIDTELKPAHQAVLLQILESSDEIIHPGKRIMNDFLPESLTDTDFGISRALHWFQMLHGHWTATFDALTLALSKALVAGRFALARLIVNEYPYETISSTKTLDTLGRSMNMMEYSGSMPSNGQEAMRWQLMKRQSRTYYELEKLVLAVESLGPWREEELRYTTKVPKPTSVPGAVKQNYAACKEAMAPVLNGILMNPTDEAEAADLTVIRKAYVPELVLAYNAVLHSAGNLITRDALLESMDLATALAAEKNGLLQPFQQARRMREAMDSFAKASVTMLRLKHVGKPWKPRKDRVGKNLGIWEIGVSAVGPGVEQNHQVDSVG